MRQFPFFAAKGNVRFKMAFFRTMLLCLFSLGAMVMKMVMAMAMAVEVSGPDHQHYDDSTITLTSVGTPDPHVSRFRDQYYMTFTAGDRIEIWSSDSLVDIETSAVRHQIWKPPPGSDHSADLWAPELHALHGRWYIYYAAASPHSGNRSHRIYVLGGPAATEDPCIGDDSENALWEFLGPVQNMPDQWAIDGTVFEIDDQLYLAYSGWPLHVENNNDVSSSNSSSNTTTTTTTTPKDANPDIPGHTTQNLYILRLSNPTTASSPPIAIGLPHQTWEKTPSGTAIINEGPQWLASPDGRWRGLAYSCGGSWTRDYKMATLRYIGSSGGGGPLDDAAWQKGRGPLLATQMHVDDYNFHSEAEAEINDRGGKDGTESGHVLFGPGHGSFLDIGNGEVVAVYHATDSPDDGWANRRARVQRVAFTEMGPYMGRSFGISSSSSVDQKRKRKGKGKGGGVWERVREGLRIVVKRDGDGDGRRDKGGKVVYGNGDGPTVGLRAFLEARRLESRAVVERDHNGKGEEGS